MLNVQNVHKSYQVGRTTYEVLKGISLSIGKGEFVAVMGPSGSGKTTLLNCISCYIPVDQGQITLDSRPLAELGEDQLAEVRNRKLGFVFQAFLLLDGLTVRENILLPAIIGGGAGKAAEDRADRVCQVFGIRPIQDKYPAEISGGEKGTRQLFSSSRTRLSGTAWLFLYRGISARTVTRPEELRQQRTRDGSSCSSRKIFSALAANPLSLAASSAISRDGARTAIDIPASWSGTRLRARAARRSSCRRCS